MCTDPPPSDENAFVREARSVTDDGSGPPSSSFDPFSVHEHTDAPPGGEGVDPWIL